MGTLGYQTKCVQNKPNYGSALRGRTLEKAFLGVRRVDWLDKACLERAKLGDLFFGMGTLAKLCLDVRRLVLIIQSASSEAYLRTALRKRTLGKLKYEYTAGGFPRHLLWEVESTLWRLSMHNPSMSFALAMCPLSWNGSVELRVIGTPIELLGSQRACFSITVSKAIESS